MARNGYDPTLDRRLHSFDSVETDGGRTLNVAIHSYNGGAPKLRIIIEGGFKPIVNVDLDALDALTADNGGLLLDYLRTLRKLVLGAARAAAAPKAPTVRKGGRHG